MRLEMSSQKAILDWHVTKPVLEIDQPGMTLDLSIEHPQVRPAMSLPKVTIDQRQCFNESGLKSPEALMDENVANAKRHFAEMVGRMVDQGNQMADIHKGGDVMADQAEYNAYGAYVKEFGMVTMPKSRPVIDVIEGKLDIKVKEGKITNNTQNQNVVFNHKRGGIEYYMKQYNSLEIRVVDDEKLDFYI